MHLTNAGGGSAWCYMRELLRFVHAPRPPTPDAERPWLERPGFEARLAVVEEIYADRVRRGPTLPWHDDAVLNLILEAVNATADLTVFQALASYK